MNAETIEAIQAPAPIIIEREVAGDENLAIIQGRAEAMNKKLAKKGILGVVLSFEQIATRYQVRGQKNIVKEAPADALDILAIIPIYNAKLEVKSVKHDGWSLLGVLSPLNGANLVNEVPGRAVPASFRSRVNECDHCGCTRNRKKTMVVAHDDGRVLCVGGSCLKDFLGHSVHSILDVWTISEEASSDDFWAGCGRPSYDLSLDTFLAWVASVIDVDGWASVSGTAFGGIPTCSTAAQCMLNEKPFNASALAWEDFVAERSPKPKHIEIAKEALAWARSLEGAENNYEANLALLVKGDRIGRKHAGLAASIVSSFQRIKMAKKEKASLKDEWIGQVGDRTLLDVTCIKVIACEGQYGTTGLHILRDAENRAIVWFASGSTEWLEVGERYLVKGTIKKHDWYTNRRDASAPSTRQTVLTRVKIEESKEDRIYSSEEAS